MADFTQHNSFSLNGIAQPTAVTWSGQEQGVGRQGRHHRLVEPQGVRGRPQCQWQRHRAEPGPGSRVYGRPADAMRIISGQVTNPRANPLRSELVG
jgi:hypothetical protein